MFGDVQYAESDYVLRTQKTLGTLIEKPRLLDKLLTRPPFRFLHDIVKSLAHSTGFPGQFLSEADLSSENIKDAQFKKDFLTKLIQIVSATIDEDLTRRVKVKKIIAGVDPEQTNYLLFCLAKAGFFTFFYYMLSLNHNKFCIFSFVSKQKEDKTEPVKNEKAEAIKSEIESREQNNVNPPSHKNTSTEQKEAAKEKIEKKETDENIKRNAPLDNIPIVNNNKESTTTNTIKQPSILQPVVMPRLDLQDLSQANKEKQANDTATIPTAISFATCLYFSIF
ncbi:hypothetical protein RFI_02263 [Reticulomyxa filosa]|uniref:TRAF3-interacting protein 1 N-terminal domain-containing protein n=1 Tax=Reticulomyxa filosa TaxID=46433 RepID=X6P9S2_RETFI|nr:hypothetical protein RFI_02263 [Reticulomyxa filosa]|eukprot:ETO34824.1 hypothetical protein RFI_02263 [Reticulomyxa filosa]